MLSFPLIGPVLSSPGDLSNTFIMMRALFSKPIAPILAVLLMAAGVVTFTRVARFSRARPNVVVLSIDALRPGMLRAYSDSAPALPNLDRFAQGAVRFTNACTTAPWTLPAHGSLLTGLYPDRHGATDPRRRLALQLPTLAEAMRRSGYRTVAFTDGGLVHWRFGLNKGFERYDEWGGNGRWPSAQLPRGGQPSNKRKHVFDRALAFLSGLEAKDTPFFLFLHTYAVHDYYLKTPGHTNYRACVQGLEPCSPADWERLRDQYRGEIVHLDAAFGRLLHALASARRAGPTILLVTADHGEGFDVARGRIHHGGRLHEDQIRIPLLVSAPGAVPRDVADPVSLVDVMPTILDLAGLPAPPALDGTSFAAAVKGGRFPEKPRYAMEHYYAWKQGARRESPEVQQTPLSLAVIGSDRWYIHGRDGEELYDMRTDPRQGSSLGLELAREHLGQLAAARLRVHKPEEASELDEGLKEQLRSLGYIE